MNRTNLTPKLQDIGSKICSILKNKYGFEDCGIDDNYSGMFSLCIRVSDWRYIYSFDKKCFKLDAKGNKEVTTCYINNLKEFIEIVKGNLIPFQDVGRRKPL